MARFVDAARMASIAGARRLFVIHTGARLGQTDPPSRTAALTEMREAFSGEVVFAEELGQVELFAILRAGEEITSSRAPRRRSPRPTLG